MDITIEEEVRTGRFVVLIILVLLFPLCSVFVLPYPAKAACPVNGSPRVQLGFQEDYGANGRTITHLGVDLTASEGSSIVAPEGGTVSYIGRVPASDATSSETMLAVSLLLADGRTLTMMPFATVGVQEGAELAEGMVVGSLATDGDRSSPGAHLHVGLKEKGVYYDPLMILGSPLEEEGPSERVESMATEPVNPTSSDKAIPATSSVISATDVREPEREDIGTTIERVPVSSAGVTAANLPGKGIDAGAAERYTPGSAVVSYLQGLEEDVGDLIAAEFPFLTSPASVARVLMVIVMVCCCVSMVVGLGKVPWRTVVSRVRGLANTPFSAVRGTKGEGRGSDKGSELVMPAGQ